MNQKRIALLILFLTLFLSKNIYAQGCLENLYKAQKLLDAGNTAGCLEYSIPCSMKGKKTSIRWQAYRLMSIAYLLQGQTDSARVAAENMLDINPTYKPNLLKDPKDFINLLSSILVIPKFSLGIALSVGTNTTLPNISKSYIVADYRKTYRVKNAYQFGTNIGFNISPNIAFGMGILATSKAYSIAYNFTDWDVKADEQLTYLDIPLTVKYIFMPQKKLSFFAQGGVFGGYLLYSQNNFSSIYTPLNQEYKITKLNSINRRNRTNTGVTFGAGTSFKIKQGLLSLQANYFRSFSPIVMKDTRYEYNELIYTYFYLDDDITLHNLAISVGYSFHLNYAVYRKKK